MTRLHSLEDRDRSIVDRDRDLLRSPIDDDRTGSNFERKRSIVSIDHDRSFANEVLIKLMLHDLVNPR